MKRTQYTVTVRDSTAALLRTGEAYARNSADRKAEALVREIARAEGQTYTRAPADRLRWTGDRTGRQLFTEVSANLEDA